MPVMKQFRDDENRQFMDEDLDFPMMEEPYPSSLTFIDDSELYQNLGSDGTMTFTGHAYPNDSGTYDQNQSSWIDFAAGSPPLPPEDSSSGTASSNASSNSSSDSEQRVPPTGCSSPESVIDPPHSDIGMMDTALHNEYRYPPGIPVPEQPPPSLMYQTLQEQFVCNEGCSDRPFGRLYDLQRHIVEQHRCKMKDCSELKFASAKKVRDHEVKCHGRELGYKCGECSRSLSRLQKLREHFKNEHKIIVEIDMQCPRPRCYLGEGRDGLFFSSVEGLNEHLEHQHPSANTIPDQVNSESQRSDEACGIPLQDGTSGTITGKRQLNTASISQAKRSKSKTWNESTPPPVSTNFATPTSRESAIPKLSNAIDTGTRLTSASATSHYRQPSMHESYFLLHTANSLVHSTEQVVTFDISIIELQVLKKHYDWKTVLGNLSTLNISSTFDCKDERVKLAGRCSVDELEEGTKILSSLIHNAKARQDQVLDHETLRQRGTMDVYQQASTQPQPVMSAIHPEQDATVLALWNDHLLPELPNIARDAMISGTYSVALVHQHCSDGSKSPLVRFRSSENQGDTCRRIIRSRIEDICKSLHFLVLKVQFSQGTVVRLTGDGSQVAQDDPSTDQSFPHQRRPWKEPGMGASIGLEGCRDITATLGGYILVNGILYMLTVDHFVSKCACQPGHSRLSSPSEGDINDVLYHLGKKEEELKLKGRFFFPEPMPLDQAGRKLSTTGLEEEIEEYKRMKQELKPTDYSFVLGRLYRRCATGGHPLRLPANPRSQTDLRRMDWSLWRINEDREGENRHRHSRVPVPGLQDLQGELLRPKGSGIPCQTTRTVVGGERAFYVGNASGFREGEINAALTIVGEGNHVSYEWTMLVPGWETLPNVVFKGDSGAWILNDNHELLGLLWGWDGGQLLFTPIHDIFTDIQRDPRVDTVELPKIMPGASPQHSAVELCRDTPLHHDREASESLPTPVEPDQLSNNLLSPVSLKDIGNRRRSSSTMSTDSQAISSLPSLTTVSSASSFEDLSREMHQNYSPRFTAEPTDMFNIASLSKEPERGWLMVRQDDTRSEGDFEPEPDEPWQFPVQLRPKTRYATV